jgi:hypothetical protein
VNRHAQDHPKPLHPVHQPKESLPIQYFTVSLSLSTLPSPNSPIKPASFYAEVSGYFSKSAEKPLPAFSMA